MEIPALNLVVVDSTLHNNIIAAIAAAKAAPGAAVWVPANYTGTDKVPAVPGVPVFDLRSGSSITVSTVNSNASKVATAAAAAQVTALTGGAFVTTLNLPGASAFEQVPFTVKAAGWVSLNGGTYTATIQPLIYASSTVGYTASAAAAIFSAAAVNITIAVAAAATLSYFPWEAEVTLSGDSTSGLAVGRILGSINNNTAIQQIPATAANATWNAVPNANIPPTLNFAAATPIQFLAGVTIGGATVSAVQSNLGSFYIES